MKRVRESMGIQKFDCFELSLPSHVHANFLIGLIQAYPFPTENHPPLTLLLCSPSAKCHVLYNVLCAVALCYTAE